MLYAIRRTCDNALCHKKYVRWCSMPQLERVMVLYAIERTSNNALCHKQNVRWCPMPQKERVVVRYMVTYDKNEESKCFLNEKQRNAFSFKVKILNQNENIFSFSLLKKKVSIPRSLILPSPIYLHHHATGENVRATLFIYSFDSTFSGKP